MLETLVLDTGPEPRTTLIVLHGLGADGHDFEPIVDELELPPRPIRFIFPHAPRRPVTINGGMRMPAWYDILEPTLDPASRREDAQGIRGSQAQVEALVARERERGVPDSRIVLAGFSQGGAVAYTTALSHPEALGGVIALSTYIPSTDLLASELSVANRTIPVFAGHGCEDDVVSPALGMQARDFLRSQGYAVDWQEYPMPHSVCLEEVQAIGRWLRERLA